MSYTPGPWTWERGAYGVHDYTVIAPTGELAYEIEREADARLIAAAPDLLAALETAHSPEAHIGFGLVGRGENGGNLWGPIDYNADRSCRPCAAVAKAKGEA